MSDNHRTPAEIEADDAAAFRAALARAGAENRLYNERVRAESTALHAAYAMGDERARERILARRWQGRG